MLRELEANLPGFANGGALAAYRATPPTSTAPLAEALLAANVAEAQGLAGCSPSRRPARTGLLLPAMSEDPGELQRFYDETVAPLVAYDEQYETELVRTLESFLDADGNVAQTAEQLFTHRHTIRYRLERVKELTGLDVSSTDGRERLSPRAQGDAGARIAPRGPVRHRAAPRRAGAAPERRTAPPRERGA